jgi:N-acetylmuramoyl-L-alanine amidase
VIAIDAGHGGKDPGAIGVGGTHEKVITLAVAREFARRLEARGRLQPVLVRAGDQFVALDDRVAKARSGQAMLFMSLHADAAPNREARGFSVYTLSETASDEMAAQLAKRENAADRFAGIDLSRHNRVVKSILLDLMARETAVRSAKFAGNLVERLHPPLQALPNTHRQANFAVLRAPDVPSVLVEMGFLSNAADEKLLNQKSYQGRLADRLVLAVEGYAEAVRA